MWAARQSLSRRRWSPRAEWGCQSRTSRVGDRPVAGNLSLIAEHARLLQHVDRRRRRFLVFDQDRVVPERWLRRSGPLLDGVAFWFLDETLTRLA